MLIAVVTSRGNAGESLINPLHSGTGAGFSDAILLLVIPVIVVMALSLNLPSASRPAAAGKPAAVQPEPQVRTNWVADCSMPWMPECEEAVAESKAAALAET